MYAIIETGGKQYRVTQGQTVDVDNLNVVEGDTVELDKVLVVGSDDNTTIGTPTVKGAKIIATSKGTVRGDKVVVFKYKPKVRYRKKTGHHQLYTRLSIDKIEVSPAKKTRRTTKTEKAEEEVTESGS